MPVQPVFAHMRRIEAAARVTMGDSFGNDYLAADTAAFASSGRVWRITAFVLALAAATALLIYLH